MPAVAYDFQRAGAFRSPAVDHLVPGASFLLVPAWPEPTSRHILTVQEMVKRLRDNGLPIIAIAEIAHVERKTVYSWLDGAEVRPANVDRVEVLFKLLSGATNDFKSLYRVWNRQLSHGSTIREFLLVGHLSEPAIEEALRELAPAIKRHADRERLRRTESGATSNPVIDEMPVAEIDT